jgi:hypothetical protein
MADDIITHGPNLVHPEVPSAVGSRNSLNRHERDEYAEARLLVDEEVDKILNHIHAKLPPEVANRMEVMGTIKSKLHTFYNQSFQNMINRYLTTVEDEMGKKVRDLVDMEELRALNRYSPRPVSYLLDRIGGSDKFNSGEVEKSIVNMFGHLQGHVQREMNDLETHTNSLLRRKTDVGAFVRGENAYAIVKCSFRDAQHKPGNVFDLKLALNVQEPELISAIFPYQSTALFLLKNLMTKRISDALDKEIEKINMDLLDEGKPEMTAEEKIFERIRLLDNYISDEETEGSRRYAFMPKKFMDAIEGVQAEISIEEFDALGIRENVFRIIENDNIRNRGWNTSVNALTHILDWSRMGYQHIENFKSSRRLLIREYEATDPTRLPDERYQIELSYFEGRQLRELRAAYLAQLEEFESATTEVWNVVEEIRKEHMVQAGKEDWDALASRVLGSNVQEKRRSWFTRVEEPEEKPEEVEEAKGRQWNEIVFIAPDEGRSTTDNPTLERRFNDLKARPALMRATLEGVFEEKNPTLRALVEGRVYFLESELNRFSAQINPFHLNPGLLLDVDIVTIKRKSTTMMSMANVLNEFLYSISVGFADQAFAAFSRRRSTQREDLLGEFESGTGVADLGGQAVTEEVFE